MKITVVFLADMLARVLRVENETIDGAGDDSMGYGKPSDGVPQWATFVFPFLILFNFSSMSTSSITLFCIYTAPKKYLLLGISVRLSLTGQRSGVASKIFL